MSAAEPINLKFKMADPQQMDDLMVKALTDSGWGFNGADGLEREVVRNIHLALVNAGCIIVQLDVPNP